MKFHFDGETFRASYDYDRLKNGVQKTLWMLLDGKWHEILDLKEAIEQDAVPTRVRDLRKPWYGSHHIDMEINPATNLARYRLDLESVEEHWLKRVLGGEARPPKQKGLTKDPEELRELLLLAIDELLGLDDIKEAQNTYRGIRKRIECHKTPPEEGGPPPGHRDLESENDSEVVFDLLSSPSSGLEEGAEAPEKVVVVGKAVADPEQEEDPGPIDAIMQSMFEDAGL